MAKRTQAKKVSSTFSEVDGHSLKALKLKVVAGEYPVGKVHIGEHLAKFQPKGASVISNVFKGKFDKGPFRSIHISNVSSAEIDGKKYTIQVDKRIQFLSDLYDRLLDLAWEHREELKYTVDTREELVWATAPGLNDLYATVSTKDFDKQNFGAYSVWDVVEGKKGSKWSKLDLEQYIMLGCPTLTFELGANKNGLPYLRVRCLSALAVAKESVVPFVSEPEAGWLAAIDMPELVSQ